jgi:hypothetical protein
MVKEKVDVFGIVPTQTGYFTAEKDKEEGVLTTWLA